MSYGTSSYSDWSYISLQEKRSEYNAKVIELQQNIEDYKKDFVILQDQEVNICLMINIVENTSLMSECLKTSIINVGAIGEEISNLPGFENLLNFSELNSKNNLLSQDSINYESDLKRVCEAIDELKSELGTNILNAKGNLESYQAEIASIDSAIYNKYCGK